ncbi:MAG: flagellar biosynthesis protein FlgB [Planctomycetes bacterium]|nr:flagellar biosynthesis protein FlgB [Planctomycetota bacterium]
MPPDITGIGSGFDHLERAMEVAMTRHRVIQTNIANANTPGYRRKEVQFESLLREAGNSNDTLAVEPKIVEDTTPGRSDGNNVLFDREYADLEKNRLQFEAMAEIINSQFQGIRMAIQSK